MYYIMSSALDFIQETGRACQKDLKSLWSINAECPHRVCTSGLPQWKKPKESQVIPHGKLAMLSFRSNKPLRLAVLLSKPAAFGKDRGEHRRCGNASVIRRYVFRQRRKLWIHLGKTFVRDNAHQLCAELFLSIDTFCSSVDPTALAWLQGLDDVALRALQGVETKPILRSNDHIC